jgi:hypothetical protein
MGRLCQRDEAHWDDGNFCASARKYLKDHKADGAEKRASLNECFLVQKFNVLGLVFAAAARLGGARRGWLEFGAGVVGPKLIRAG